MSNPPAELLLSQPDRPEVGPPAEAADLDPPKVLVVEDEACAAFLYKSLLQREGYTVQHCADGDAALQALAAERFDAVILDLMMPKTDGMQVLKMMRGSPEHAMTPVIILTAARLKLIEDTAIQFGARLYLEKSQQLELMQGLRQIVAERASLKTSRLRMAPATPVPEPRPAYYQPRIVTATRDSADEGRGWTRLFRPRSTSS